MRAVRPDVNYHTLYLGEIFDRDPGRTEAMLQQLAESIEVGSLHPLPLKGFDLEDAASAFRYMAQARHIGKVVLSPAFVPLAEWPRRRGHYRRCDLPRDRRARQPRAARGALAGGLGCPPDRARRPPRSDASSGGRDRRARSRGAHVVTLAADIAQRADVDRVLAHVAGSMPPLRGIVHAAGVLDDGVILGQTWTRLATVMAPKVRGAWNLHEATRALPLDFFVMFSSIASALGSPGQANYASANALLDALAHYRRGQGLPALSINWGPWADGGMAAGAANQISRRWSDRGLASLTPDEGLRALGERHARPRRAGGRRQHRLGGLPARAGAHSRTASIDCPRRARAPRASR